MTQPWRSMSRAPKDREIVVAVNPESSYARWLEPVLVVEWLAEESKWWQGGCWRYDAGDFLGWMPMHPASPTQEQRIELRNQAD